MNQELAAVLIADMVGYSKLLSTMDAAEVGPFVSRLRAAVTNAVESSSGNILKTAGDGFLIRFTSSNDALDCAVAWQNEVADSLDLQFRIGINIGDISVEEGDAFGNGVNVAARLEEICPPGEICVSDIVRQASGERDSLEYVEFGTHQLKNIASPIKTYLLRSTTGVVEKKIGLADQSAIRYCLTKDGASIAHATVGEGYPLVFAGSWLTHLEQDWSSTFNRPYFEQLARYFHLIRYDQRGNGMSDWNVERIDFESMVDDLELVIDQYDYDKVALFGASQAASVSVAYACKYPERVSHIIIFGGYARGRKKRGNADDAAESEALLTLIRKGWGSENPVYRNAWASIMMPNASPEELDWFNAFQRATTSPENAARFRKLFDDMDVADLVSQVSAPALIMHSQRDLAAPLSEARFLTSAMPDARLITFDSDNHMLLESEPDFPRLIETVRDFVNG